MAGIHDLTSARRAVAIDYSGGDQTLSPPCRALLIETAGNLAVRMAGATEDVTLTNLSAGQVYPLAIAIIRETDSTAAGKALY